MRSIHFALAGTILSLATAAAADTTELSKLNAQLRTDGDAYGFHVYIDDLWIAVTDIDPGNDPYDNGAGRVFLYDKLTTTPHSEFSGLRASGFGHEIRIDGQYLYVGSPYDDQTNTNEGAVKVYDLAEDEQVGYIQPSDPTEVESFGFGVAVDDGVMIAGAPSSYGDTGYVYALTTSGEQLTQFTHPDVGFDHAFGFAVAFDGEYVAIGAPGQTFGDEISGAVYVFSADDWNFVRKLQAPTPAFEDLFGTSIELRNGLVYVGAPGADETATDSGGVYIYDSATGSLIDTLLPDAEAGAAGFGNSIALDGDRLLVGARLADNDVVENTGAAYLFHAGTGKQITKYVPSDVSAGSNFGVSVDLDGDRAIVGASNLINADGSSGAAYLFDAGVSAPGDMNNDGCVDGVDLAILLASWGGASNDIDDDGVVATPDLAILLAAWGC